MFNDINKIFETTSLDIVFRLLCCVVIMMSSLGAPQVIIILNTTSSTHDFEPIHNYNIRETITHN